MSMVELFSVYDSAAERYLDPFCAPTPDVAIRGFRSVVNKVGHPFNDYPADYTLFHVGSFDPETGLVESSFAHSLGNGVQYLDASVGNGSSPGRVPGDSERSFAVNEEVRDA